MESSLVVDSRDTGIEGYRNIRIQGYRNTRIQGYRDTRIHDTGMQI